MKNTLIILTIILLTLTVFLLARKAQAPIIPNINNNGIVQLKEGRQCYTYNHEATTSEPVTSNEFLDINIVNNIVTGTKTGSQAGSELTNGYTGTIVGTLENNVITDVYSYVVEGASGKEKEIYRAGKTGLEKMRYPLTEGKGMFVPDTTKEFKIMNYARVGCEGSN